MQFTGTEAERRERLVDKIAEAALCGIDFIQLREKNLSGRELECIARKAVKRVRASGVKTRLLINSRADVALATGADGVHLRSNDISAHEVRRIWSRANGAKDPVIAVSCHTKAEVVAAEESGADFVVFGPVFEKSGGLATGVDGLHSACGHKIPVFALGGVTSTNARLCIDAGGAGIAGIRLFQENEIGTVVKDLRG